MYIKLLLLFFSLVVTEYAKAEQWNTLYTHSFENYSDCNLYTVNSSDSSITLVGSTGISRVTDIAFRNSKLYGITFDQLIRIDPSTGNGKVIGDLGVNYMNALTSDSDGNLYAASSLLGDFIKIDPDTGNGVLIGNYGNNITSSGDLVFSSDGELYASVKRNVSQSDNDWLAKIDLTTGSATLIGDIGYENVFGLSYKNDILYGTTEAGQLLKINTLTGEGILINNNSTNMAGLATSPILSPIVGKFGIVTNDDCSDLYKEGKWCLNQHMTGFHRPLGGVGGSDDTYAWDVNLNNPIWDFDDGKPVFAVAPGVVADNYAGSSNGGGGAGQVLIQHENGEWWSGYLHLKNINVAPGDKVTEDTHLGDISNVLGYQSNHLHFVLYTGINVSGGLTSYDTKNIIRRSDVFCVPITSTNGSYIEFCP